MQSVYKTYFQLCRCTPAKYVPLAYLNKRKRIMKKSEIFYFFWPALLLVNIVWYSCVIRLRSSWATLLPFMSTSYLFSKGWMVLQYGNTFEIVNFSTSSTVLLELWINTKGGHRHSEQSYCFQKVLFFLRQCSFSMFY